MPLHSNRKIRCIETPAHAAAVVREALPEKQKEERIYVLPLDANGKMLANPILVSVGYEDGTTTVDPGAIFRAAFKAEAEEIIVAHNHPSGDPTPSKADIATTKELKILAERLGVRILDHIILGNSNLSQHVCFSSIAETIGLSNP